MDKEISTWLEKNPKIAEIVNQRNAVTLDNIMSEITYHKEILSMNKLIGRLIELCQQIEEKMINYNTYLNIGRLLIENPIRKLKNTIHKNDSSFDNYYEKIATRYFPNATNFIIPVEVDEKIIHAVNELIKYHSKSILSSSPLKHFVQPPELLAPLFSVNELEMIRSTLQKTGIFPGVNMMD